MLAAFCFIFGLACWEGDRPPPVAPPAALAPAVAAPAVAAPAVSAPAPSPPSHFDAACDVQPPDGLKDFYWLAYQSYPLGATDCELARQGMAESAFKIDAVSPAGAIGVAQFLPKTAAELEIDPRDPGESIRAQARYLLWCRDGWDPSLAGRTAADVRALGLGCYNFGRRAMYDDQRAHGWIVYLGAKPHLPRETQRYVFKIEGQ